MSSAKDRVAIIGDIGGHSQELLSALVGLGADPRTLELPTGLTVIQVGDLVHRGPDSPGVLAMVAHIMDQQPAQWVQLAGNHELQYLTPTPRFQWPETLERREADLLRYWWAMGRMKAAVAVSSADGDWLVAHGGLTHGFWQRALDEPPTAAFAATAINSFIGTVHEPVLLRGGVMIEGAVDLTAGPIWAECGSEVATSWLQNASCLPFNLAHGHSTPFSWSKQRWQAPRAVAEVTQLDQARRHSSIKVGEHRIVGVDPSLGHRAGVTWEPLVLIGARVVGGVG